MGKLQSKNAFKRRESPEGGSFVANVPTCQRELESTGPTRKAKLKQELCRELKEAAQPEPDCHLEVTLPPETTSDREHRCHLVAKKQNKKWSGRACDTECNVTQEWLCTLYNFDNSGKVTKEDMSSLMHSIHEVVEASVKQPIDPTSALRVKLVLTPSAAPEEISQPAADSEQCVSQRPHSADRSPYCVDENEERRNHYLDLAGIENYASKFDNTECSGPGSEPRRDAGSALHRHHMAVRENCGTADPQRHSSVLHSFRSKPKWVGEDRNGGGVKTARFHGHHPTSTCHPSQPPLQGHAPLLRSHSKRLRSRVQDAASPSRPPCSHAQPGGERRTPPGLPTSCVPRATSAHRHEHHHQHEHHHHHHHHHYYSS